MGLALISFVQNHWPFAPRKLDDLGLSDRLVSGLSIPEDTKKFVYAFVEPESQSVVYVLAAQNLSKQSAIDAEILIKEIRPDVVVTQVAPSSLAEIRVEEKINKRIGGGGDGNPVPTSLFGVLKGCFVDKINKDRYESLAGSVLLKAIFGVGFYGHFLSAKKAAMEVGSSVYFIESPFVSSCADDPDPSSNEGKKNFQALNMTSSSLVPQNVGLGVSSKQLFSNGELHSEAGKLLVSAFSQFNPKQQSLSGSVSDPGLGDDHPVKDYQVPSFAQTVYPLLIDLHNVFGNLPSIGLALAHAQKMLHNIGKGETVDIKLLSEVQSFQIAVEGLRIGLNSAGRCPIPISKAVNSTPSKLEFSELPTEDKSQALFAQAIRSQTQNFKSIVAIVDANSLAGLRKHWNTPLPLEVKDLVKQFVTEYESEEAPKSDKKRLISDKQVVAVGAGATAVLGATSFSKAVPASTFMKLLTYKAPASLKIALSKVLGTSKVVAPGYVKATATSNKIRAVSHSVRAYAQRTSFSAMRTAFYEIMRKRHFQPIGSRPLITFGCSISACAGLLVFGDGIECAVESIPVAPAIASLGRGLQSLHQANQVVRESDRTKIQEAIQSLMYRFKK